MLNKLLKYDLKYICKSQILLYGITGICLIIAKIFEGNAHQFFIYYSINLSFLIFTYTMIIVLIINNITKLWVRFKSTIYGEEAYLTHTLPIEKKDIYLSKILSAIITLSASILFVAFIDLIIRNFEPFGTIVYITSDPDVINTILLQYTNNFEIQIMMWFMILTFLISVVLIGYFSIIIGYRLNKNKLNNFIIIGIVTFILTVILLFPFYFIIGIICKPISDFLYANALTDNIEKGIIMLTIIFSTIVSIIYYSLGLDELRKGINVE